MENRVFVLKLCLRINIGAILICLEPGFSCGESAVFYAGPLHRGPAVVSGMDLKDLISVFLRQSLLLKNPEMIQALHILILGNICKSGVGHSQLLALVNIRSSSETVDHSSQHFCRFLPVLFHISKSGNYPWLVMVAPEYCIPGMMFSHVHLPAKEDFFQLLEIEGNNDPLLISHKVNLQMVEAENHGQFFTVLICILITVFHGGAGHLSHGDDLCVCSESGFVQFPEIFMDIGTIGIK